MYAYVYLCFSFSAVIGYFWPQVIDKRIVIVVVIVIVCKFVDVGPVTPSGV